MTEPHPELNAAELRTIANRLMLIAEQQAVEEASGDAALFDDEALVQIAREELDLRRSRRCFLDEDLFSEPSWDVLLELFIANVEKSDLTVSNACVASGVPRRTAMRYVDDLEDRGLVMRYGCDKDGRVQYLALTHLGTTKLKKTLRHYAAIRLKRSVVRSVESQVPSAGPPHLSLVK
jgi:DNA-binding MarR family transcriptional regulator